MTNILFVCNWNRFRSNSAEAIFNHLNKNPEHRADSAGFFPGVPITSDIVDAGKKIGVEITYKQRGIQYGLMMWSDIIIIVADNIPVELFREIEKNDKKKIVKWEIKDVVGTNVDKRAATLLQIKKKVEELLQELGQ